MLFKGPISSIDYSEVSQKLNQDTILVNKLFNLEEDLKDVEEKKKNTKELEKNLM